MTDSFSSPVVTLLVTSVSPSGKGIRAIGDSDDKKQFSLFQYQFIICYIQPFSELHAYFLEVGNLCKAKFAV